MEPYSRKPALKTTGSSTKLPSLLPQYTHIVNPRLRHTYLSFDEAGNLIIKSPKVSPEYIEQLLLKKAGWIRKSRERLVQKKGKLPDFTEGSELYYKGSPCPLKIIFHSKQRIQLQFEAGEFFLYTHQDNRARFRKQIDLFYKTEAKKYLPSLIEKYAQEMQLFPEAVRFRKTKRQWGSCSAGNRLSFNTMLMKLPLNVIEYVVVHELAHIAHKHHQKSFWKLIEAYMPDYKARIRELHTYTT